MTFVLSSPQSIVPFLENDESHHQIIDTTVDASDEDPIRRERHDRGQCPHCGQQCYELKKDHTKRSFRLFRKSSSPESPPPLAPTLRREPLSIPGRVERGQCLCYRVNAETTVDEGPAAVPPPPAPLSFVQRSLSSPPITTNSVNNAPTATYDGPYNEYGERHGEGVMVWNNGDKYVGSFAYGLRHGLGSLFFQNGAAGEYVGDWDGNVMHGHGTRRFPNGDVYVGEYNEGTRHGAGRFYFANGDLYVGAWQRDKMTGEGRYYYSSGQRFEGSFCNGKRHGKGKSQRPDGALDIFLYQHDSKCSGGVRWSLDRKRAWKLDKSGAVKKRITTAEAVSLLYEMDTQAELLTQQGDPAMFAA